MIFRKHIRRRAISPILAEVMLIAITLVTATALSGFVFGMFGTLSSSAHVQVMSPSCTGGVCTLYLSNTGTAPASVTRCSIYGTAGTGVAGTPVPAGSSRVSVACTDHSGSADGVGTAVSGSVALSNGMSIPFYSVWTS